MDKPPHRLDQPDHAAGGRAHAQGESPAGCGGSIAARIHPSDAAGKLDAVPAFNFRNTS